MTNQELINKSLFELKVIEAGDSGNATDSATLLQNLNQMMAEWGQSDCDFNWFPQDTLGDTVPVPDWALGAITSNLAVYSAAEMTMPVTGELLKKAQDGLSLVTRTLMNLNLEGVDMDHVPLGYASNNSILTDQ